MIMEPWKLISKYKQLQSNLNLSVLSPITHCDKITEKKWLLFSGSFEVDALN